MFTRTGQVTDCATLIIIVRVQPPQLELGPTSQSLANGGDVGRIHSLLLTGSGLRVNLSRRYLSTFVPYLPSHFLLAVRCCGWSCPTLAWGIPLDADASHALQWGLVSLVLLCSRRGNYEEHEKDTFAWRVLHFASNTMRCEDENNVLFMEYNLRVFSLGLYAC